MTKVDAKVELIRVTLLHEIARIEALTKDSDKSYLGRQERVLGLRFAVKTIDDIDERVR